MILHQKSAFFDAVALCREEPLSLRIFRMEIEKMNFL
ncbi:MAG: hypothetical protein ACI81T_002187 [Bacteroidia bacterium]|jgi:hypothetical protein